MKAKVVPSKGRAECRLCYWEKPSSHTIKKEERLKREKRNRIPKDDLCLEIQTARYGPTMTGYLCKKHAEKFQENINEVMRELK